MALVYMPFAFLHLPSIGLSLLNAALTRAGIESRIWHFTLDFARRVGVEAYSMIAEQPGMSVLLGEWVFRDSVFRSQRRRAESFYQLVRERLGPTGERTRVSPKKLIRIAEQAHEQVPAFLDACADRVLRWSPTIVGFTSVFQQHLASLALAKRLKDRDGRLKVIFGGPSCEDALGIETLRRFPYVDAVVLGDGDVAVPEVARRVSKGHELTDLQGVYTRQMLPSIPARGPYHTTPLVHDLDRVPYPAYDDYFEELDRSNLNGELDPVILFETSRGCWWGQQKHCTFCGLNDLTISFRQKSSRRALSEVASLVERYPGFRLWAVDNILPMSYFRDFLPAMASRRKRADIFYQVKANLSEANLRVMRDAGIRVIQPGIESLSTHVLNLIRKGVTGIQNVQLLKNCEALGVDVRWNLLWGFPGEDPEEYDKIADLIPLLSFLRPPEWVGPFALDRFSPYWERPEDFGLTNVQPEAQYAHIYPLAPDSVRNLAYYFTFSYADGRDVEGYTKRVRAAVERWRAEYGRSALYSEVSGRDLLIWDLRPGARDVLTTFSEPMRSLYLGCRSPSTVEMLRRTGPELLGHDRADLESALLAFVGQGLMIHEEGRYLSLAIPMDTYSRGQTETQKFMRQQKTKILETARAVRTRPR